MTLILGITHLFIALLTIGAAMPLVKQKVPMNQVYGVRIHAAFESEENWYRINHYGGKCLIGWSIPVMLIGIGLIAAHFCYPIDPRNLALITLFSFTPILVAGALPQVLRWTKEHVTSESESSAPTTTESPDRSAK